MSNIYTESAEYYDKLWNELEQQSKAGVNSRHRKILSYLKKSGLKKNPNILEIGAGIGTLSSYLAKSLNANKYTGVDISPKSVEFASKKFSHQKNLEFIVSDMQNFIPAIKYDLILFPDVLEHIPIEGHHELFKNMANIFHDESIIAINHPDPRCLRWFAAHNPEALQLVDQDIEINHFTSLLYPYNFYLHTIDTYNLYLDHDDYEWILFKRNSAYKKIKFLPKSKVIFNGMLLRLRNFF